MTVKNKGEKQADCDTVWTGTPVQKKEINKNVGVVPLANPDIRNNNKRS